MNQRELSEIRRRWKPDKNAVSRIYGCYVNGSGEIIAETETSLGNLNGDETEQHLAVLKKALSGTLGKNLRDIVFSTEQVMDSPEHKLLTALRNSKLEDAEARHSFYERIAGSLDMDGSNYLILLAHDSYDVPRRGADGETRGDEAEEVFSYFLCAVCPVKDGKPVLGCYSGEKDFHDCVINHVVSPPELGFMFPCFDDRRANIYNALFYSHKTADPHEDFINAVFNMDAPMSPEEQREIFREVLSETVGEACDLDLIKAIQTQLADRIEEHKANKEEDSLTMTARELGAILEACDLSEELAGEFTKECEERFGKGTVLSPENLFDTGRFEINTPQAKISVAPEYTHLIKTQSVEGRKYILIPAFEGVDVNGFEVTVP